MQGKEGIDLDVGGKFADTGGWTRLNGPEFPSNFRSKSRIPAFVSTLHCHRAGGWGLVLSITISIHTTCSLYFSSIPECTEFDKLGTPSSMLPDIHSLTLL